MVTVGESEKATLPPMLPVVGVPSLPKAEPPEMAAEVLMVELMLEIVTN
jgi:hypothetical protein